MLDEMRMRTACFAHASQRCTRRLSKHFLLTFQEVTPLRKTRNQLVWNHSNAPSSRVEMGVLYRVLTPQGLSARYGYTTSAPGAGGVHEKMLTCASFRPSMR